MAIAIEKTNIMFGALKINKLTGNITAAHIEDSDTYLDIANTIAKTKRHVKVAKGFIAKNAPHPVATPLPPLKFKNMVNICPKITANITAITNKSDEGLIFAAINTGTKPFNVSQRKAKSPKGLLTL